MGTRFANLIFPELSTKWSLSIEYLTIYLSLPVFSTFLFYLFSEDFKSVVLKLIAVISLGLSAIIIPFDEVVYISTLLAFEIFALITLGYICYVLLRAIRMKRKGSRIILAGFMVLFLSTINDILYDLDVVSTGYYLPLGLFGYILFQALHLSHRSSWNLRKNEELSAQLAEINVTLEHRVKTRTAELRKRNEQLQIEIAEHQKTSEELAESKLLAEDANQAKSEFLANMSHELRTPMHGILGFAKFGEEKIDRAGRESLLDFFREIKSCGERLLVLLNDLLDLSKLESGKIIYDYERNDLCQVVDIVLKELKPLAKEKQITLDFQTPEINAEAVFDEGKMIQVVRNLVSNAIRYSPDRSKVNMRIENQADSLSFAVVDRGVGIPGNELNDVFDKFVQSSKTKTAAGGTGLGLPISQKIIIDHKGEIWAANNAEGGAIFTFVIPKIQNPKKKLGEILVEQKLISKEELVRTLHNQQKQDKAR